MVEKEAIRIWTWFMQHMHYSPKLQNTEGITSISDIHKVKFFSNTIDSLNLFVDYDTTLYVIFVFDFYKMLDAI